MSITAAQLSAVVTADISGLKKGLGEANDHVKETGGFFKNAASTLLGFVGGDAIVQGVGDAFGFLKDQLVDSVKAGMDANTVMAATVAHLKSTRDASGMTAQSIGDLATHIMSMSGIDDDAVQSAENMLLTFKNIGKSTFPDATQAAADMATTMNGGAIPSAQQMQQAALQLGKALDNPTTGMSALQRVGVTFSDQQKEQIKNFMKAGDVADAQRVILKELNTEFGNSATAAGHANGGLAILAAQANNLKESLGQQLIPILTQVMSALEPLAQMLLGKLSGAIAGIAPLAANLEKALSALPLGPMSAAFERLADAGEQVGAQIQAAALPVLKQLGGFFTSSLLPAVTQFTNFAATTLVPMFGEIAAFLISTVGPAVIQLAKYWIDDVLPANEQLVAFFKANVLPVLETLVKVFIQDVLPVLEQLNATIMQRVIPPIERMIALILPVLVPAFQAIGWVVSNVVGPVLNWLLGIIGDLMDKEVDMATVMVGQVGSAFNALGTFAHNVGELFSHLGSAMQQAGHDLIQGLINGITGMLDAAKKAVSNVGGGILSTVKGMFGISSPSTVFAEIGSNLSQGLINGVKSVDVASEVGAHLAGLAPQLSASLGVNASVTSSQNLAGLAGVSLAQQAARAAGGIAAASGQGGYAPGTPINIHIAGHHVAQVLLPDMVTAIRRGTGIREY